MKSIFNICNIYILLWCFFDVTFLTSMPISRPLFVVIFAITVYYVVYACFRYTFPLYLKSLAFLLLFFTIYGVVLLFSDVQLYIEAANKSISRSVYLITIYKSLLPIVPFYVFAKKGCITEQSLQKWLPVFLCVAILTFYMTNQQMVEMSLTGRTEFTNNAGYLFVALLPYVFWLYKKPMWQYIMLLVLAGFITICMKRGAILICVLFFIWFLYCQLKRASVVKTMIILALVFVLGVVALYLVEHLYENSEYFRLRIEDTMEGGTSGRDAIYENCMFFFKERMTALQQCFGMGAESTLLIGDNYAHNDWLEILINNGILGLLVYLGYWRSFYKETLFMPQGSVVRKIWISLFLIYFVKTFFSMSYGAMPMFATLCVGYCLANTSYQRPSNHIIYLR